MDRNRDRGSKKWTGLFLTEHMERLRDWYEEDNLSEQPHLDEWELQSIQEELEIAFQTRRETVIKTWNEGSETIHQGVIAELDTIKQRIVLEDSAGIECISVHDVFRVQNM